MCAFCSVMSAETLTKMKYKTVHSLKEGAKVWGGSCCRWSAECPCLGSAVCVSVEMRSMCALVADALACTSSTRN